MRHNVSEREADAAMLALLALAAIGAAHLVSALAGLVAGLLP